MMVDNYDSFTWNLVHYLEKMSVDVDVFRNDEEKCLQIDGYDGIIISPGPGMPDDAGFSPEVIQKSVGIVPVLGVCLGLQAIVRHFGGKLLNLSCVLHGKQCITTILDKESVLFRDIPETILTGYYHSWVAAQATLPSVLKITAVSRKGDVMALDHITLPVTGVQFHPESVLTPFGLKMISNWVNSIDKRSSVQ